MKVMTMPRFARAAMLTSVSLLLLPAVSAASGGHRRLPKGTPYAAEVIATVQGESHITWAETSTRFDVCETESAISEHQDDYDFNWRARYPQVTVPVADKSELGRAFKRLHVRVQPTARGRGGLTSGEYFSKRAAPVTSDGNQGAGGSDCAKQSEEESGTFGATRPTFADLTYNALEGRRRLFEFQLGTIDTATHSGSSPDPRAELEAAASLIPPPTAILGVPPEYNSVPAEFRLTNLKRLLRKPSITVYRRTSQTRDCGGTADELGEETCSVEWNYQFRIKLTRRFFYRTKRSYPK